MKSIMVDGEHYEIEQRGFDVFIKDPSGAVISPDGLRMDGSIFQRREEAFAEEIRRWRRRP